MKSKALSCSNWVKLWHF